VSGAAEQEVVELFVVGAHLVGQPLVWQLTDRRSTLRGPARTAAAYRLVALVTDPPKPGLLRVPTGGAAIDGERWSVPVGAFGSFVAGIPSPLTIGKVELDDGALVCGFLCEAWAAEGALDITAFGGWRRYLAARQG
jgi:allophanate hydrolase